MTNETEKRNPIEVLSEEFLDRQRVGEQLSISEFAAMHPDHADKINRLFPAMMALESCKSSRLSSIESGQSLDVQFDSPSQLGDFKIVREIGRGGMGVVYEAVQQSLQRRVALKVFPRQALPDSKHLDRFHREAKTAARLHHTNIVPVFGVGQQDDLHYYVMQRIDGVSIDDVIQACAVHAKGGRAQNSSRAAATLDHARSAPVSPSATPLADATCADSDPASIPRENPHGVPPRTDDWCEILDGRGMDFWIAVANVGIQVADALQYAHLQGVLHRDIKPSNLLLDGMGTVWVTDLGLATALEAEQGGQREEVAGTLRFMAPEHISGVQDTRSDIYSLGLTLYELATSQPAFDDPSRTILLSRIMKGDAPAARTVRADIPRDLEAIISKSMERQSDERYATAGELGSDLRRFVRGLPVAARPLAPPVRLTRWTMRNPVVAALGMALLITGISSLAVIGSKWKVAVAENQRAEDNLTLALESMDQILQRFTSSWMAHPVADGASDAEVGDAGLEMQVAVSDHSADVLQDALKFYDRFAEQNPTNPQLYRDIAKVHRRVADIYQRLGQHAKANAAYERSLGFLNSDQIADDDSLSLERAETHNQLGFSLYSASRFASAEVEFRTALREVSQSSQGSTPQGRLQEARIRTNLAKCLSLMLLGPEADESQRAALTALESLVADAPNESTYRLELARAYRSHYRLIGGLQRHGADITDDDRERVRASAVDILEDLVRDYPNVPDFRCELSETLATISRRKRHGHESREQLERAVSLAKDLTESHPSIPRYRAVLARGLMTQADCKCDKRVGEAGQLFDESISLFQSLIRSFPDMPVYRIFLVRALHDQAETLARLGHTNEARDVLQSAISEQVEYTRLRPENEVGMRFMSMLQKDLEEIESATAHRETDRKGS